MLGRTRPPDQHPRGKPPHPSTLSPSSPLGISSIHPAAEPRMQKNSLASSHALDVPSETRLSQLGEVSHTYTKQLHEEPHERTKAGMLEPCMAECPSLPQRSRELAPIRMHASATPSSSQLHAHTKDVPSSHPTNTNQPSSPEPHSTDFHLENGSVLGPNLPDHNTNGSRPPPINHTPKQPSHGSPSHHEQPQSLSSNPCSGNGGTRTNLEQPVTGTFAKRDSKFCPDTGSPMDSNGVEPGVPIPKSAAATQIASSTTNPTTTLPQALLPNSGATLRASLPPPSKTITSPISPTKECSTKLIQCGLLGPTARNHFPLPRLKRSKHCHAGRRAQSLHCHVLKPQPTICRVRHALGQARQCGSSIPHQDHHGETPIAHPNGNQDSANVGSSRRIPLSLLHYHEDNCLELPRSR